MKIIRLLVLASASFFYVSAASAQTAGTVTNHAFAIGKGAGVAGYSSLLCPSGQFPMGQTSADPQCVAASGDATISAAGVVAIGANKVTNAQFRQSGALALVGRSANSTGNVADIQATAASSCVFQENASALVCASLGTNSIAANAVTNAKLATMGAYTLKGNSSGSTAAPADIDVTALTAKASPISADIVLIQDSAASNAFKRTTVGALAAAGSVSDINGATGSVVIPLQPGGRLTLTSATPITTTDVTAATSIYYAPLNSPYVPIYNGANVRQYLFTSSATDAVGLTVALGSNWTLNTNYDWFVGLNSSTVTLCSGPAWSSDTARGTGAGTTELQLYNGLWTNKNSMTCRYGNATTFTCAANQCTYLGTGRTVAAGQMEDSAAKRFVYNAFNQVERKLKNVTETGADSSYTSTTPRQANANTANQLDFVVGLSGNMLTAQVLHLASTSAGGSFATTGIGIDSTTVNSADYWTETTLTNRGQISASLRTYPAIGRHFYAWLEFCQAVSGTNAYSYIGTGGYQAGISASILM